MVYFISDAHLGCRAIEHRRTQERRLVRFLDQSKDKAEAVYMLGDMFDFWFEYRQVVPRGFTRFLGKVSELTDSGVEVHWFLGNHDMWTTDYLERECGVIIHREPCLVEIYGSEFYLAHGHHVDIAPDDWRTRLMFRMFENPFIRRMATLIHPDLFVDFGLNWARHSRMRHQAQGEEPYKGEHDERMVCFAKQYLATHPTVNYFIFGHRHIELDLMLSHECRLLIIGEWYSRYTYACFDGSNLIIDDYIEGETNL